MKNILIVGENIAGEATEELSGRTPLEAAKTPVLDRLAREGKVGFVSTVPASYDVQNDIALLELLGYDAGECYTGLAPIEAAAFGIDQDDRQVLFRCDLVTILDEALIDETSGAISDREAGILFAALEEKLASPALRFLKGRGYKNFIIITDAAMLEELDELECTSASAAKGQAILKVMPKGQAEKIVSGLIRASQGVLDAHEINRVRVDLGENPANRIWMWGQGKKPRLQKIEKKLTLDGAYYAQADYAVGLSKLIGLHSLDQPRAVGEHDFYLFHFSSGSESRSGLDLKTKVRRAEEFDNFVGEIVDDFQSMAGVRLCVACDVVESIEKKSALRAPTPYLWWGEGIIRGAEDSFSEKISTESRASAENAHNMLKTWLSR